MSDIKNQFIFKIVVVGDSAVGKTSLIKNFTQGTFKEDYIQTIGAQLSNYEQILEDNKIQLFLWDIAGQDNYHFLRPAFYKGSRAAIVVYSLESSNHGKRSLAHVDEWYDDIKEHCGEIPIILFGNKVDLVKGKKIKEKKVKKIMKKRSFIGYYKTSAKTGEGVIDAFNALIKQLYEKYKDIN
jgi:small GTP-binding protein